MKAKLRSFYLKLAIFDSLLFVLILFVSIAIFFNTMKNKAEILLDTVRNDILIENRREIFEKLEIALRYHSFLQISIDDHLSVGRKRNLLEFQTLDVARNFQLLSRKDDPLSGASRVNIRFSFSQPVFFALGLWSSISILLLILVPYLRRNLERTILAEQEKLRKDHELRFAKQVAHDIRSPLSAVNMILPSLQGNHPEQTQILRTALKRINDIAQDLLDRKTAEENPSSDMKPRAQLMNSGFKEDRCSSQIEKCDVVLVVRQIVLEKNVQIQKSDIQITIDTEGESVFAQTNAKDLSRILSNLLNNSIEAKDTGRSLEIQIFIRQYNKQISIVVMDNGVGIPSDKIALLGQVGVSFGKDQKSDFASHADNEKNVGSDLKHKSGTGLGLAHAKQALESWGGQLKIQSSVGVGTQMHLQLPGICP